MRALAILTALLVSQTAIAAVPAAKAIPREDTVLRLVLRPDSRIWLEGDSTLHPYRSSAGEIQLAAVIARTETSNPGRNGILARLVEPEGLKSLELTVPVLSLKSGKKRLDKNMYKSLKAKTSPQIAFSLLSYEVQTSSLADRAEIRASGRLSIAGVVRVLKIEGQAHFTGDTVRFTGRKALKMSDFGIKPPVMFFGALKTDDQVVVFFDLKLGLKIEADLKPKNETRRKS